MKLALLALGTSLALAGCATGPKDEDHAAHHPAGGAAPAPGTPSPGQADSMMKSMQAMHERMMAARTPEERARLMQEHMKLMQDGMGMMGRMHGDMAMSPEMMQRRMDMMEMMMQMMMDREGMAPPASPAR